MKKKILTAAFITQVLFSATITCSCWNPSEHTKKEQLNKFVSEVPQIYNFSNFGIKIDDEYVGSTFNGDENIETYKQGFKESATQLKNNQKFFLKGFDYLKYGWSKHGLYDEKTIEFTKKYFDYENLKSKGFKLKTEFVHYSKADFDKMNKLNPINIEHETTYDFSLIDINNLKQRETIRTEWDNGWILREKYVIKNNLTEFAFYDVKGNHLYSCFKYIDLDSGWIDVKK